MYYHEMVYDVCIVFVDITDIFYHFASLSYFWYSDIHLCDALILLLFLAVQLGARD